MKLEFTIGEVSKIFNISIDTLRYYDKIKLFSPQHKGENGYRYYYLSQFDTLATIKILRALGVSIEEITSLLSQDNLNGINNLFYEKRIELKRQMEYLKLLDSKLNFLLREFSDYEDTSKIELRKNPRFWALLTESIMETNNAKIGNMVKDSLNDVNPQQEWLSLCHTISIVSKSNVILGKYHNYLNNGFISTYPIETEKDCLHIFQPKLCAYKSIIVEGENYNILDENYEKMKEWIKKRNLQICGDSMEINIYNQYKKHYIQLFIPVEEL